MAFIPGLRRLKLQLQQAFASGARALARDAGVHVQASIVEVPNGRARGGFGPGIWHVLAQVVALAPEALAPGSKASAPMTLAPGLRRLKL